MRGVIVGTGKRLRGVVHRVATLLTSGSHKSRELQESKARLEEAQRVAHVGYWVWDLDSDRVTWSDETYRIYGLMPQKGPLAMNQRSIDGKDKQVRQHPSLGTNSTLQSQSCSSCQYGSISCSRFL